MSELMMPFGEALAFFKTLSVLPEAEFEALAKDLGDYANSQAFTVAHIANADLLQDVYDEVLQAIESGSTFSEFREGIDEIMARRGWTGLAPYRLDNIFRTNIQTAYNVGRYRQMSAIADRRPYWQYDAVNDSRTRPSHMAHDGKVYHHTHPFWDKWYPPNGYRCFPEYIKVLTPGGWKEIGSILRNDRIIGGSGDEKRVTAVHNNGFNGKLVRLILKDGRIDTTPNHRILTMRGWVRADKLNTGDVLVETAPMSRVDAFICDEYLANTESGNCSVPGPIQGKPSRTFTTDSKIQLWDKDVQPFRSAGSVNNMIVNRLESKTSYMVKGNGLGSGRKSLGVRMLKRIPANDKFVGIRKFFTHLRSPGGCGLLKSSRKSHRFRINGFGLAEMPVNAKSFALEVEFSQLMRCVFVALFRCMQPLSLDGFSAFAGLDVDVLQQSHQCSRIYRPPTTQSTIRQLFGTIQPAQRLGDGAPLDRFYSIDGFKAWTRSHGNLRQVMDCRKIPYTGSVVNLTVETDESYVVQGATVHNCRCRVNSLSAQEMGEEKLTEEKKGTNFKPDPAFAVNPAKEPYKPDLGKYAPALRAQIEEAIHD